MRYLPGSRFPDPHDAPGDAPLAVGGDLRPETLLDAYAHGIFPWPSGDGTLYWWSPNPRAVFPSGSIHISRTLRRTLRAGAFRITVDTAFSDVVAACADRPCEGTWITPAIQVAYTRLHRLGHAHSVEVREPHNDRLVGGIYGVALGGAFMGESMFHRVTDASKVALVHLARRLEARGFSLLDAQLPTPHLSSMGAQEWSRARYLKVLEDVRDRVVTFD